MHVGVKVPPLANSAREEVRAADAAAVLRGCAERAAYIAMRVAIQIMYVPEGPLTQSTRAFIMRSASLKGRIANALVGEMGGRPTA